MRFCNKILTTLFFLIGILQGGTARSYRSPVKDAYPILAWYSLDENHCSEDNYRLLSEAGFNLSLTFFSKPDKLPKSLNMAEKYRVKLVMLCRNVNSLESLTTITKYHKGFGMYYVSDEPSADKFQEVGQKVGNYKRYDKEHMSYVNLLPNHASRQQMGTFFYKSYIKDFIRIAAPDFISFDNYPFVDGTFRRGYYENLETISEICTEKGIPFWGFVRTGVGTHYSEATEGQLRFQAFCNIAYGAQGLQYFTYAVPDGYISAILDSEYRPTRIYYIVKCINAEIQRLHSFIDGSRVVKVWHISNRGRGLRDVPEIESYLSGAQGFLFSLHIRSNRRYLMIVNKDYNSPQGLSIKFKKYIRVLNKGEKFLARRNCTKTLAPGDFMIIQL